jgi:hypothetical protein
MGSAPSPDSSPIFAKGLVNQQIFFALVEQTIITSLRGDAVDEAISEMILEFASLRSQRQSKETFLELLLYHI